MFERLGQIVIHDDTSEEDILLEDILEAGANDFTKIESNYLISTDPTLSADVSEKLDKKGYNIISSSVEMVPKDVIEVEDSTSSKLIDLIENLEDHDDIQKIASNFEIVNRKD